MNNNNIKVNGVDHFIDIHENNGIVLVTVEILDHFHTFRYIGYSIDEIMEQVMDEIINIEQIYLIENN